MEQPSDNRAAGLPWPAFTKHCIVPATKQRVKSKACLDVCVMCILQPERRERGRGREGEREREREREERGRES